MIGILLVFLVLAQSLSLLLSVVKRSAYYKIVRLFRVATVVLTVFFFAYYFTQKSISKFSEDSVALQLVNKLPQPIDFYVIIKNNANGKLTDNTVHSGIIRSEYYRLESLNMRDADEFWIAGYLGKKNMVYFSQHVLPNKNVDQIIEVNNYLIQSKKLSDQAKKSIEKLNVQKLSDAVRMVLCLLMLFMNTTLLLRKK